jgi:hypothetical protein
VKIIDSHPRIESKKCTSTDKQDALLSEKIAEARDRVLGVELSFALVSDVL